MRKIWIAAVAFVFVAGWPFHVYATEAVSGNDTIEEEPQPIVVEECAEICVEDPAESVLDFFEHELFKEGAESIESARDHYSTTLEPLTQDLYDKLATMAGSVANGESSTTIVIGKSVTEYYGRNTWSAQELGMDVIYSPGDEAAGIDAIDNRLEAYSKWKQLVLDEENSEQLAFYSAIADYPYDFYWRGISYSRGITGSDEEHPATCGAVKNNETGKYDLKINENHMFIKVSVSKDYATVNPDTQEINEYEVDVNKTNAVKGAADNAREIVNAAETEGYSDYQKLDYYKNRLCELNEYNYEAAFAPSGTYGDPWQVIYMLDGDPNTKVVCEGYAKTFKYLCDLSSFSSPDIYCFVSSGHMSGSSHMWNTMCMEDGRRYLVDVTNCDGYGQPNDSLFMAIPVSGNVDAYVFRKINSGWYSDYTYIFDVRTRTLQTDSELTYSNKRYANKPVSKQYTITFDACGGKINELSRTVYAGDSYGELPIPSREGYDFVGWYDYEYDGDVVDKNTVCCENATIYAYWKARITPGWKKNSKGYRYMLSNGKYVKSCWKTISGKRYHFDKKGYRQTGWIKVSGKQYYLNSKGVMQKSKWIGKKYYVDKTGKKVKNCWKTIKGKRYHFDKKGRKQTGWIKVSGKKYYLNSKGVMQKKKWIKKTYYVKSNGVMARNEWIGKYYVDDNGRRVNNIN